MASHGWLWLTCIGHGWPSSSISDYNYFSLNLVDRGCVWLVLWLNMLEHVRSWLNMFDYVKTSTMVKNIVNYVWLWLTSTMVKNIVNYVWLWLTMVLNINPQFPPFHVIFGRFVGSSNNGNDELPNLCRVNSECWNAW